MEVLNSKFEIRNKSSKARFARFADLPAEALPAQAGLAQVGGEPSKSKIPNSNGSNRLGFRASPLGIARGDLDPFDFAQDQSERQSNSDPFDFAQDQSERQSNSELVERSDLRF